MDTLYNIDYNKDKPDIAYMVDRIIRLMAEGIKLKDIDKMYNEYITIQQELKENIQSKYNINNPNSSKQITDYMKYLNNAEVYDIACIEGKWSSNKEVLGTLRTMGYEFASDILDYRSIKKYAETMKSLIDAKQSDGRVRPVVSLGKTNRVNYSGPALMNIPKALLWNTVAPRVEGNLLFSVDIKNQEPSILIQLLDIEELKPALLSEKGLYEYIFSKIYSQKTKVYVHVTNSERPRIVPLSEMEKEGVPPVYYTPVRPPINCIYYNGEKLHTVNVCNVITNIGKQPELPKEVLVQTLNGNIYSLEVKWDEITSKQLSKEGVVAVEGEVQGLETLCKGVYRSEFKQSWNAMTYGASIFGVRAMCKHIDGDKLYKYFTGIKQFKQYKSNCTKLANNNIQVINSIFGTQMHADTSDQSKLKRVLMDMPIQGTGADILSLLIKHFDEEVAKRDLKDKLMLYYTRHDELIIEADKEWALQVGVDTVIGILRDICEHRINDWIPFKVEIKQVGKPEDTQTVMDEDMALEE